LIQIIDSWKHFLTINLIPAYRQLTDPFLKVSFINDFESAFRDLLRNLSHDIPYIFSFYRG